jgi:hypothetical protein
MTQTLYAHMNKGKKKETPPSPNTFLFVLSEFSHIHILKSLTDKNIRISEIGLNWVSGIR